MNPVEILSNLKIKLIKLTQFKIITKYVLKEFIPTFIITFSFFFFIFIINHILLYIKPLFEKDVPLDLIAMLLITAFPMYIIFCLPFGVMLATLMTMGRFSTDNEIVAFRALGFHMFQIFLPVFFCGLMITLTAYVINDQILPYSLKEQFNTIRKITKIKPTLDFKSKTVKRYLNNLVLITDIVKDTSIEGLVIIDQDENDQKRIITTVKAEITSSPERSDTIQLKLNKAMVQFENKDRKGEFNYGYADEINYYISLREEFESSTTGSGNEKTTGEIVNDLKRSKKELINDQFYKAKQMVNSREEYRSLAFSSEQYLKSNISNLEYLDNLKKMETESISYTKLLEQTLINRQHNFNLITLFRKFALPLACLIFTIFASPIGIYSKRSGRSIGFIVGLFLCAFYWFFYYAGQILGIRNMLSPFLAIFLPNLIFLLIGIYFLIKRLKE